MFVRFRGYPQRFDAKATMGRATSFAADQGESTPGIRRAGRLDGRVQSQQVRLLAMSSTSATKAVSRGGFWQGASSADPPEHGDGDRPVDIGAERGGSCVSLAKAIWC
jgi:hypothetical protein